MTKEQQEFIDLYLNSVSNTSDLVWIPGKGAEYLSWVKGESSIRLDGDFSISDLEAIVEWIRSNDDRK